MRPILRILLDVLSFRLRRLEMANMVGAVAILWAMHAPWIWEGVVRCGFAVALNVLVYLNNDFHDLESDLEAATRELDRTRFLATHRTHAVVAQLALGGALLAFALFWGGGLWRPLVLGGGVCWMYSLVLKRRPVVDVLAMMAWGATMPMVGVVEDSPATWSLLAQLGLFSGCFESIQVLRDRGEDTVAGVRTSAVVFGATWMRRVIRILLLASACFAGWAFHPALALGPAAAALLPPREEDASRYWNRVRILLGCTFVLECVLVYLGA